jgi:hypothetical protein
MWGCNTPEISEIISLVKSWLAATSQGFTGQHFPKQWIKSGSGTRSTDPMAETDNDTKIDELADRVAEIIQAQTRCSEAARDDLKFALAEFADEIKRQAIEP